MSRRVAGAKLRSRWMMTDFLGGILIAPATVEHTAAHLKAVVDHVHLVVQQAGLKAVWVVVEPGNTSVGIDPARRCNDGTHAAGGDRRHSGRAIDERSFGERPAGGCR